MSARRKSRRPLLVFSAGNLPVRSQSKTVSFATPSSRAASLRPLNALAENFWRVTQAIPDAPIGWRVTVAFYLTKVSMSDKPHTDLTSVEWSLAYQTWRSEKDVDAYENAIKIGLIPKPPTPVDLSFIFG